MSLPPCSPAFSTAYFSNIIAQINALGSSNYSEASELQSLINQVFGDLSVLQSTMTSQLAVLEPLLALVSAPANPAEVITWIGNFITGFLTPYIIPYTTLTSQLGILTSEVASLTSAIEAVASGKGWSITIPAVTNVCEL